MLGLARPTAGRVLIDGRPYRGAGLAYLIGSGFARLPADQWRTFDPPFASSYSLTIGQLALVVFGVLIIGGEHGSGTIRASLAAIPRRACSTAASCWPPRWPRFRSQ